MQEGRILAAPLAVRSDNNVLRLISDFMTSLEIICDDMTDGSYM